MVMQAEIFDGYCERMIHAIAPGKSLEWFAGSVEQWYFVYRRYHHAEPDETLRDAVATMIVELSELPSAQLFLKYVANSVEKRKRQQIVEDAPLLPTRSEATDALRMLDEDSPGQAAKRRCIETGVWDRAWARGKTHGRLQQAHAEKAVLEFLRSVDQQGRWVKEAKENVRRMACGEITWAQVTDEEINVTLRQMAGENTLRGTLENALNAKLPPAMTMHF